MISKQLISRTVPGATLGVLAGLLMTTTTGGCGDDGPLGQVAEQCGLSCSTEGILEGNASISGLPSIDAFFGAVIDVRTSSASVRANVQTQVDAIALSVGLERGATIADIRGAIEAKVQAAVDGGLVVEYEPPRCQASVEVTVNAAAECDVEVTPGELQVRCEGSCEADVTAEVDCGAEANVVCEFTPPNLQCEGQCSGTCQLEAGGTCEGTCRGGCSGTCSVTDANGNCAGECTGGECTGSCELAVAAECSGSCEGTCRVTNPAGGCEANATVKCEAMGNASVECNGTCEGSASPPDVKAECEAAVDAKANASVECTPPSLQVNFQWSAEFQGDADAQAQFRAWLEGFKGHFSALIAASAKAELVLDSGQLLIEAAGSVVSEAAGQLAASGDFAASIKAGCGVQELGNVPTALGAVTTDMQYSVQAFGEIGAAVGAAQR